MYITVTVRERDRFSLTGTKLLIMISVFRFLLKALEVYMAFNKHLSARKFGRMFNYQE